MTDQWLYTKKNMKGGGNERNKKNYKIVLDGLYILC